MLPPCSSHAHAFIDPLPLHGTACLLATTAESLMHTYMHTVPYPIYPPGCAFETRVGECEYVSRFVL
jgi:hypothetical protein